MNKFFWTLLVGLLITITKAEAEPLRGILLQPLEREGKIVIRAGELVSFSPEGDATAPFGWAHTEWGKIPLPVYGAIPLDQSFTPSRAYLWMKAHPVERRRDKVDEHLHRYHLCQALAHHYSNHPLTEELRAMACDFYREYEGVRTMGKTGWSETLKVYRDYLVDYPRGRNADRIRYAMFKLENSVYEYEGSIRLILGQIELYQRYLVNHPNSKVLDQIKSDLARLYRMAFECFPEESGPERTWVRSKAVKLNRELLSSENLELRESARVNLYNLEQGRRCYRGPTDW